MTAMSQHAEWLSLIDISGPFLAEPVLKNVFPQGLEELDTSKRRMLRQAYDEWREALELEESDLPEIHAAWIDLVLRQGLELDEDGAGDVFKAKGDLPETLSFKVLEHGVTLRPDYAVVNDQKGDEALMLVAVYDPDVALDEASRGDGWAASPAERMVELCRATGVRLGLVTNGKRWMFIDAPVGAVATFATWHARLWGPEPKTLQAFVNLLGIRRFFVDKSRQLPALLDESLKLQDEVTDALGEQVRRAVEVLIQSLDRANVDRNYELLEGVEPTELYEAALTVMMRIVFLLSAEERGLLLMGDERYEANYAISTLRMQLRGESEEILERRWDAWSRLLAIFRAIYGGIEYKEMRLPALGGSLFDPDRFPFLEGRPKGSNWKFDRATPLPIDNRTVLLLLDAVQLFQGRTLSYRALDVEQIGYVYEGLLERTVVRAKEVTLDLDARKSAKKPWVSLDELDDAATKGDDAVSVLLKERTDSSASRVTNDLAKKVDEADAEKLLTACHGDQALRDRIKPYFHFLRIDPWGYPFVYPINTFMVTTGSDRRETGTHYTPKSLTEAIVKETLEPVAYIGPAEGKPREDWQLKSPAELLDLKICDPAMGSGAFLVQVCRWLSERLVEAWSDSEQAGNAITSEGVVVDRVNGHEPLRADPEERLLTARRLIAERCLYGVDVNPLAVELAKLSIWLVTLAKGRPFGFLDHNLRSGDSLLGMHHLDQLFYLKMSPGERSSKNLFASRIDGAVREAMELRAQIRGRPIFDIRDVEIMATLDERARDTLQLPGMIADALAAEVLVKEGKDIDTTSLSIEAGRATDGDRTSIGSLRLRAKSGLSIDLPQGKRRRQPFHWPLEFPEVFAGGRNGFDAVIGNPPFLGGKRIAGVMGRTYLRYLINIVGRGVKGSADLIAYFLLRAAQLTRSEGTCGLITSNSIAEGGTREVGLENLRTQGCTIYRAISRQAWPGKANVVTSQVYVCKGVWAGIRKLDGRQVDSISAFLTNRDNWEPVKLAENAGLVHQGNVLLGKGFIMKSIEANSYLERDPSSAEILFPFLRGQQINQSPNHSTSDWVITFWDWCEEKARTFNPRIFERLAETVKAERQDMKSAAAAADAFWRHLWYRAELYHNIGMGKYFAIHPEGWDPYAPKPAMNLVFARAATKYPCFTFVPNKFVYSDSVCVIPGYNMALFGVLSSDIHSVWAWEHGSKMKEDLRYTHGDVFETFPFPPGVLTNKCQELTEPARIFFEARREYMLETSKGMTKFYNDFHDPDCKNSLIVSCREFQEGINDAVMAAYGIDDIDLNVGFHRVSYAPEGKNTRFTMSEEARSKVLERFALINKRRHESESDNGAMQEERTSIIRHSSVGEYDLFTRREGSG